MKKWVGSFHLLILDACHRDRMGFGFFFHSEKDDHLRQQDQKGTGLFPSRMREEKGEADPYMLQILKEIQKKLDEWLKSLNETD